MKVMEQLKNHKYYLLKIKCLKAHLEALQSSPQRENSSLAEKIREQELKLTEAILAAEEDARAAEALIAPLPEQLALLMRLRYIDGLSWKGVGKAMRYSVRHCYCLHRDAVRRLEELYSAK